MDWRGWITFGPVATGCLTAIMIGAQLAGRSRMDMPLMLGTTLTRDFDRARVVGALMHLAAGQGFAVLYVATFASFGWSSWWLGAAFGMIHGLIALTLIVPLLPGVHRSMASRRSGPRLDHVLEPPGLLALNYGREAPIVAVVAHVAYGAVLGGSITPS